MREKDMERQEKHKKMSNGVFKRLFGVKKKTYGRMRVALQKAYERLHRQGGKPPKLSVEDKLMMTLQYLREYRTMEHIGYDYGVSKSTVCETIQWVEDTLKKEADFKLPGKRRLAEAADIRYVVVDVTESPIERPKKNKRAIIPGKRSGTR